jgi:hypothetical protein
MTEGSLLEYRRCPLRTAGGVQYPVDPYLLCGQELWKWLSLRAFRREIVSSSMLRTQADVVAERLKLGLDSRKIVRIARRLKELSMDWTVVQPVLPYVLGFGSAVVKGEYGVVSGSGGELYVVSLAAGNTGEVNMPDLVSMLRLWHLGQRSEKARVLQYSVGTDYQTIQDYRLDRVGAELVTLTDAAASKKGYAIPGNHCNSCRTHACEGVLINWTK